MRRLRGESGVCQLPVWNAVDQSLSVDCVSGCSIGPDVKAARQIIGLVQRSDIMPLATESLPDRFDAATHRELDRAVDSKAVEDHLGDASVLGSNPEYFALLHAIIENSNGDLDTKYLDWGQAKKLITQGELRDVLNSAWERKSYREVRNLGTCLRSLSNIC